VVNPDGSGLANLTDGLREEGLHSAMSPSWSADGRRIVFSVSNIYVFVVNVDGSGLTRLKPKLNSKDLNMLFEPSWSPDGKYIGFSGHHDGTSGIYVVAIDDTPQDAISLMTDRGSLVWHPSWSPDGKRVAFHAAPGDNVDIYVVDVDGSGLINLTDHPARDSQPAWSP
jgi:TolB protein